MRQKEKFEKKFVMNVNDADFGYDDQNILFLEPDVLDDCRNDPEVQISLDREIETLREDQRMLRIVMACRESGREGDESSDAPGNIRRTLQNANRQFRIDKSQPSDLHPRAVIQKVQALLDRLIVVVGNDPLSVEAQTNATTVAISSTIPLEASAETNARNAPSNRGDSARGDLVPAREDANPR